MVDRKASMRSITTEEGFSEFLFNSPNIYMIKGFFVDYELASLNLLLKRLLTVPNLRSDPKVEGVIFSDLVKCLHYCCHPNIQSNSIGCALRPSATFNNQEGLAKEVYPDVDHNKKLLEGTKILQELLEVSAIIAQLAGGQILKENNGILEREESFEYPLDLKIAGILPLDVIKSRGKFERVRKISVNKSAKKDITQTTRVGIDPNSKSNSRNMVRFWLVVKDYSDLETTTPLGEYFIVKDVKVELEARKILLNSHKEIKEVNIDDTEDPAYIFAKSFSDNIELLYKHYPVFKRVKDIYRAMLMADWLIKKRVRLNFDVIDRFYERETKHITNINQDCNKISPASNHTIKVRRIGNHMMNHNVDIPANPIANQREKIENLIHLESHSESPVSRGRVKNSPLKRIINSPSSINLTDTGPLTSPTSKTNIFNFSEMINNNSPIQIKIIKNKPTSSLRRDSPIRSPIRRNDALDILNGNDSQESLPSVHFNTPVSSVLVFGGVWLDLKTIRRNKDIDPEEQQHFKFSRSSSPNKSSENLVMDKRKILLDHGDSDILEDPNLCSIVFPFQREICHVCETFLNYREAMYPVNKLYYCRLHHPMTCSYCFRPVKDKFRLIDEGRFHYNCVKCKHCGQTIQEKLVKINKDGFIHYNCMGEHLNELIVTNKLNEMFNVSFHLVDIINIL